MQRRKFLTVSTLALGTISTAKTKDKGQKSFVVKSKEARFGTHTPFMGVNPNDLKISGKDTNGQLSVFEYVGTQKVGPSLHVHFEQDEIFTVIEGEYLFQVGDKKETLKAGDTIFLPRNIPHTWLQISDLGKLIYFLQPAGKMEEFFMTMNQLQGRPSDEEMQKIHAVHGMKVIGPPLSLK
ncbi:MAG: cupin domain-containing protein [Arcicella sp.]|jgi:quercetin 2,3-dioxygenase|nr:cupin domain-containing protein [Arcicella sp.]